MKKLDIVWTSKFKKNYKLAMKRNKMKVFRGVKIVFFYLLSIYRFRMVILSYLLILQTFYISQVF